MGKQCEHGPVPYVTGAKVYILIAHIASNERPPMRSVLKVSSGLRSSKPARWLNGCVKWTAPAYMVAPTVGHEGPPMRCGKKKKKESQK